MNFLFRVQRYAKSFEYVTFYCDFFSSRPGKHPLRDRKTKKTLKNRVKMIIYIARIKEFVYLCGRIAIKQPNLVAVIHQRINENKKADLTNNKWKEH